MFQVNKYIALIQTSAGQMSSTWLYKCWISEENEYQRIVRKISVCECEWLVTEEKVEEWKGEYGWDHHQLLH